MRARLGYFLKRDVVSFIVGGQGFCALVVVLLSVCVGQSMRCLSPLANLPCYSLLGRRGGTREGTGDAVVLT